VVLRWRTALSCPAPLLRARTIDAASITSNAKEFCAMLATETERWRKVVELSGQKME